MIKAVIFDMGGVVHTMRFEEAQALTYARETIAFLAEHGIVVQDTPETFFNELLRADEVRKKDNKRTGRELPPLESWADIYLQKYNVTRAQIFPIADELALRWSRDRGEDIPREGLFETVDELRSMGMRLGVISNTQSRSFVPWQLCKYGVSKYFEYVLLSSVCGLKKPDPAIFELCEQTMGLEKHELAYVGDTISRDVIGVRDAGWALMIRILHTEATQSVLAREKELEAAGYKPDYIIHTLTEIPEIIRQYNANCAK
ncbi:HAD family hydrolase [Christensenellaceae bacterium OttesenSCG-928-L17]|nr:HAD family hydrolase [Christensenellaceae bacterium OttesenSCG-928-L17]